MKMKRLVKRPCPSVCDLVSQLKQELSIRDATLAERC